MENRHIKWFLRHSLIVVACALIAGAGIAFVVWVTAPPTTIIGPDITARHITVSGDATIVGDLKAETGRTATIVVAASDSSPGSKAQADFVADGVDDHITIQAAIDALPAGGGKVLLLEGKYHVGGTAPIISLRSNLILAGVGPNSIIRLKDNTVTHAGYPKFQIIEGRGTAVPMSKYTLKNFAIDGNIANQVAGAFPLPIQLNHSSRFHIEGMYIFDSYTAIEVIYSSLGSIINNQFRNQVIGDSIGPIHSSHLLITGNIIERSREGIDLHTISDSVVANNVILASQHVAIEVRGGSSRNIIAGNTIVGEFLPEPVIETGIRVRGTTTTYNIIQGNIINDNVQHGIDVDSPRNTISQNNIEGALIGIVVRAASNNTEVSQNHIYNTGTHGIHIIGGTNVSIKGNTVTKAGACGIFVDGASAFNWVLGNHVESSAQVHVENNNFTIWGSDNTIQNNTARMGVGPIKPRFGLIIGGKNNVIKGNDFRNSGINRNFRDTGTNNAWTEAYSELFMDVFAATTAHVVVAQDLTVTPPYYVVIAAQPDIPRNVSLTITDANASITAFDIDVVGVDARGNTQTAKFVFGGGLSQVSNIAFAKITSVVVNSITGAGVEDVLDVGISNRIGLPVCSNNFDGVFRVARNGVVEAVGAVDLVNATVDLGIVTTGDHFLIHYTVNLNIIR